MKHVRLMRALIEIYRVWTVFCNSPPEIPQVEQQDFYSQEWLSFITSSNTPFQIHFVSFYYRNLLVCQWMIGNHGGLVSLRSRHQGQEHINSLIAKILWPWTGSVLLVADLLLFKAAWVTASEGTAFAASPAPCIMWCTLSTHLP